MKIYITSDHAGFALKEEMQHFIRSKGHKPVDLGPESDTVSVSYALQGKALAKKVVADNAKHESVVGIAICGTGIGISMAANRVPGARAARVTSIEDAQLAKKHNNANILTFGARQINSVRANKILEAFLDENFEEGRHVERIEQMDK